MSFTTRTMMLSALLPLLTVSLVGPIANATPASGHLNFAGTATVSLRGIDFLVSPDAGTGLIIVLPGGNTGDFSVLNSGWSQGTIRDLDEEAQSDNEVLNIQEWLTLASLPSMQFTLESIHADTSSAVRSPYTVTSFSNGNGRMSSTASFSVHGTMAMASRDVSSFDGFVSATFHNVSYQQLLSTWASGRSITAPFVAQIAATPLRPHFATSELFATSAVPEPSSLSVVTFAVLAGSWLHRRRCTKGRK